ncbi:hypothetical protein C942_02760 [Photobacterium marinum]|uniref:Uncharacterized protein n=1 Tax=Photobacterium marinum TaxID=1056511 RepID=L8JEI5_9GAMM|nr:hypothetical protein [Photobacterium marinum]ELR67251.1 hypothetical protein C942_02760 [Photobacterium marinum]
MNAHDIKTGIVGAYKEVKRDAKDLFFGNTRHNAFGIQDSLLLEARESTLYVLANTNIERSLTFDTGLMGNYLGSTTPLEDLKSGCTWVLDKTIGPSITQSAAGQKIAGAVSFVGESISAVMAKIKALVASFFQSAIQKMKKHYECFKAAEYLTEAGTWLASEFADNLTNLIPGLSYAQNAADLYEGVKTAVLKSKDFVSQMYKGIGVELLNGHPSIISKALARHSLTGAAGGIAKAGVASAKIGIESAANVAAGVGTLVSVITGLIQRILTFIDKVVQSYQLNKILEDARNKYTWSKMGMSLNLTTNEHKRFCEWFQGAVITTPIVAALVMGSGYVSHPYYFLKLIDSKDMVLTQKKFNKGVHYIQELQKQSGSYIREYSDAYDITFTNRDGVLESQFKSLREGTRKY